MMLGRGDGNKLVIDVNRLELIKILKKNLNQHVADYNESLEKFWIVAEKDLTALYKEAKKKIQNKSTVSVTMLFKPDVPMSYESSYKDAIEMLELSVNETIKLDHGAFKRFVKDEWEWKQSFNATTSFYKGAA
ncbi:MAG TPA: hypothetical protein PK317_04855 [Coprothermobacter proteolyticus]|nr:hypothetical protein [Coprothermobacter proteolyticus]